MHASLIITQNICFIHDQKTKDMKNSNTQAIWLFWFKGVHIADSILKYLISKFILVLCIFEGREMRKVFTQFINSPTFILLFVLSKFIKEIIVCYINRKNYLSIDCVQIINNLQSMINYFEFKF